MKKKIIWGIVILLALFLILHGFLGKNARQRQTGEVFYLRPTETANALYKAQANTDDETLIYTHEGKGDCNNQNIIDYYYSEEDGLVHFIVLAKDETGEDAFALYSIRPGDAEPQFEEFYPSYDGSGPFEENKVKLTQNGKTLLNQDGNLCLRENGETRVIKRYMGTYDPPESPGYEPIGILPDGNYALYRPTASGWKWMQEVNEFFTRLIFHKEIGEDIYIIDLRDNTTSSYIENAYNFQFVAPSA